MIFKSMKAELGASLLRPIHEEYKFHFVAVWLAYDLNI